MKTKIKLIAIIENIEMKNNAERQNIQYKTNDINVYNKSMFILN